jgi:hypothetical protein
MYSLGVKGHTTLRVMDGYLADGPPPPHQRVTREEIRAPYGV